MNRKIALIDAYNIMYRAFHGNKADLKTQDGIPTNALHTMLRMIVSIKKYNNYDFGVVVFDGKGGSFRDELIPDYKEGRSPMPDDLRAQIEPIKEGLKLLGWPMLVADGYEADDIIGTLATRASVKGNKVDIYSGDKDFRQLVDDNVHIIDTMYKTTYDRQTVFEKMKVYPEQVVDYLSLLGDSIDNVNGIAGVGKKTASDLITTYGSIEGMIANQSELKGKVGDNIRAAINDGSLELYKKLITLKLDVEMEMNKEMYTFSPAHDDDFDNFCVRYELASLIKNQELKDSLAAQKKSESNPTKIKM
jgi:DNA polymerase I